MNKQLKAFKKEHLKRSRKKLEEKGFPKELVIVSEGDSWFDYPLKKDIIDYLRQKGFAIENFAKAGDTLENMIYGSDYIFKKGKLKHSGPISLQKTLTSIKNNKPQFFLFSGGGNDIVGSEIISYLNHSHSKPTSLINKKIFKEKILRMEIALQFLIEAIIKTNPKTHILMDGYDYAKVNGKGYSFLLKNIRGPWILPSMAAKAIINDKDQKEIIKYFVDKFNILLKKLDRKYSQFNHIDLRGKFPSENEWDNEIHLKNNGFKKIASIYHERINELLTIDPTIKYADRWIT